MNDTVTLAVVNEAGRRVVGVKVVVGGGRGREVGYGRGER